ncbi:hypothetical protein [Nitratireductor thuwali]|uniref:Uncharacterized protein n=1 Tax=Nitratireductor thuwali TaxID=2267699 RepID=A0ABY5MM42_9HYPH|nr:hypothetical protein NTH_02980 [Nitratireductor thuwali]
MPKTVPDKDVMNKQQAKDLGHATKSQPEQAKDAEKETATERIERDTRANRAIGSAMYGDKKTAATERKLERAAERNDRARRGR